MQFFIDTAMIQEIREGLEMGIVDGVTTNPTLISRTDRDFTELLQEICKSVDGPVSAEVIATETDEMLSQGRRLSKISANIVVKLPMTTEGLKAARQLREEGIRTNMTLCFSPTQALLAAKAGADYVSPFIGRLDNIGSEGMKLVEQIRTIFDNYEYDTQIIVASVHSPMAVADAAMVGADVVTAPLEVLKKLVHHPLTNQGLEKFLQDWEQVKKANRGRI
jgi:transaldolase